MSSIGGNFILYKRDYYNKQKDWRGKPAFHYTCRANRRRGNGIEWGGGALSCAQACSFVWCTSINYEIIC